MARILHSGAEIDGFMGLTTTTREASARVFSGTAGTQEIVASTAQVRSGTHSWRAHQVSGGVQTTGDTAVSFTLRAAQTELRMSFWVYLEALPNLSTTVAMVAARRITAGALGAAVNSTATQARIMAEASTTTTNIGDLINVPYNTWLHVICNLTLTTVTVTVTGYGTSTATLPAGGGGNFDRVLAGQVIGTPVVANGTRTWYIDDVIVDQSLAANISPGSFLVPLWCEEFHLNEGSPAATVSAMRDGVDANNTVLTDGDRVSASSTLAAQWLKGTMPPGHKVAAMSVSVRAGGATNIGARNHGFREGGTLSTTIMNDASRLTSAQQFPCHHVITAEVNSGVPLTQDYLNHGVGNDPEIFTSVSSGVTTIATIQELFGYAEITPYPNGTVTTTETPTQEIKAKTERADALTEAPTHQIRNRLELVDDFSDAVGFDVRVRARSEHVIVMVEDPTQEVRVRQELSVDHTETVAAELRNRMEQADAATADPTHETRVRAEQADAATETPSLEQETFVDEDTVGGTTRPIFGVFD